MMKDELTNVECLLILAACLAGVVAVMGCYTVPEPTTHVDVCKGDFLLVTCSPEYIRRTWNGDVDRDRVLASANMTSRIIKVPCSGEYDKNGLPIPDLQLLGHETLHMIRGDWHE